METSFMQFSPEVGDIAKALAGAQGAMKPAAKDSENPHFRSSYADLASIWDACREQLAAQGLSVVQGASAEGPKVTVETLLMHASGQWIRSALTMTARDATPQSIGSAITYGRRYGLAAIAGVAPDDSDDDGEQAQGRGKTPAAPTPPPPPPPAETKTGLDRSTVDFFQRMSNAKKALGAESYYRVLGVNGFEHAKDVTDPSVRTAILEEMRSEAREQKAA